MNTESQQDNPAFFRSQDINMQVHGHGATGAQQWIALPPKAELHAQIDAVEPGLHDACDRLVQLDRQANRPSAVFEGALSRMHAACSGPRRGDLWLKTFAKECALIRDLAARAESTIFAPPFAGEEIEVCERIGAASAALLQALASFDPVLAEREVIRSGLKHGVHTIDIVRYGRDSVGVVGANAQLVAQVTASAVWHAQEAVTDREWTLRTLTGRLNPGLNDALTMLRRPGVVRPIERDIQQLAKAWRSHAEAVNSFKQILSDLQLEGWSSDFRRARVALGASVKAVLLCLQTLIRALRDPTLCESDLFQASSKVRNRLITLLDQACNELKDTPWTSGLTGRQLIWLVDRNT